jgi:acyl-homoserine lactone acylase PvdQ
MLHLLCAQKPPKAKIGFFFYLLCLALFVFSVTWTHQSYRYSLTLPLMRGVASSFESLRHWHHSLRRETPPSHSLLSGDVKITHATPSGAVEISGQSVEDVLFGQGYAHCSERLFQMDYNRHRAAGTLAQVFDAKKLLSDKWARALDLTGLARRDLGAQSPSELALLKAYAAGVNAFLAERHPLPLEYRAVGITDPAEVAPWLPEHSLAVLRLHTTGLGDSGSEAWERELTRALVEGKMGAETAAAWGLRDPPTSNSTGSTTGSGLPAGGRLLPGASSSVSYVVSGELTQSGAPIISTALVLEVSSAPLLSRLSRPHLLSASQCYAMPDV